MMTWDARERPSAREMLQHPWIRKDGVAGSNVIEPEVLHRLKSFANMNALKKHTLMVSRAVCGPTCLCQPRGCAVQCVQYNVCSMVCAVRCATLWQYGVLRVDIVW
jgi:hypothetical protein